MLADAGRVDEAIAWYQPAAEAGDRDAAQVTARLLADAGRVDEAITWYRRAEAWPAAASLLHREGRPEEAVACLDRAARDGHCTLEVAEMLADAGHVEELSAWYRNIVPDDAEDEPGPISMFVISSPSPGFLPKDRVRMLGHIKRACGIDTVISFLEDIVRSGKYGAIDDLVLAACQPLERNRHLAPARRRSWQRRRAGGSGGRDGGQAGVMKRSPG